MTGVSMLHGEGTIIVQVAFGADPAANSSTWTWTDVTADVLFADGVNITQGRADESSQTQPAQASFTLLNQAGNYSAYDPRALYWPGVTRGTPVRVQFDAGGGAKTLFLGYAVGFEPAWSTSAKTATVKVTAAGSLRRLTQGKTPFKSPMYRVMTTSNTPAAYWPFEDGTQATGPTPGIVGGPNLTRAPGATFKMGITDGVPLGSPAAGSIFTTGSASMGRSPAAGNGWTVAFAFKVNVISQANHDIAFGAFQCTTNQASGTPVLFYLKAGKSGGIPFVGLFDEGGNSYGAAVSAIDAGDGQWHTFVVNGATSGANTLITTVIDGVTRTGTYASIAPGRIKKFGLGPDFAGNLINPWGFVKPDTPYATTATDVQVMHVGFFDTVFTPDLNSAVNGYVGELAHVRLARLCTEQHISLNLTGTSDKTMGAQTTLPFIDLARECETTDGGVLYDGFDSGLSYVCLSSRYNQTAAVTADVSTGQLAPSFTPADDDQRTRNDYTVSRSNGGSAHYQQTTGALSVNAIGLYDSSLTVNLDTDNLLDHYASWNVHLGTVEGLRYPTLAFDLVAVPSQITSWIAQTHPGFRLDVTNVTSKATQHPPNNVSTIVEGYTMKLDLASWKITANCSPYAPWRIATVDDGTQGLVGSAHTFAALPLTSGATALPIIADAPWTTSGGDMPFDINYGGERCTVSAIGNSATPLSRVGARIGASELGAADFSGAYTNWQAITSITLPVTRHYKAQGDFTVDTSLSQMVSAGLKVCLTIRPDYNPVNPSHLASLDTMLSTLKGSGANLNVTLWHEPFFTGLSAAQFTAMVRYYGPTVRKYYPLWFVCSGSDADVTTGFYPGDGLVDGVAVDAYAASGQTQVTNAQSIADAGAKPFGIWEFNGGADLGSAAPVNGQTQAAVTAHFQFLQTLFTNRLAAGKPNGDLLFFSASGAPNGSANFLGTGLSANGGFEGGIGAWVGAGNSTIALTGTQHNSFNGSLQMTSNAAGNMLSSHTGVTLPSLTANALACTAGDVIEVSAWYKASTVGRTCQTAIFFYDATAVQVGTAFPPGTADVTTGWTNVEHHATAPATTAWAVLRVQIVGTAGAGEVHYVDDPQIAKAPTPNDLTSPIQYPWDYRIALLSAMKTALDSTSFPQQMTVTRSVNGVVKAHPSGDSVDVWTPAVVGL